MRPPHLRSRLLLPLALLPLLALCEPDNWAFDRADSYTPPAEGHPLDWWLRESALFSDCDFSTQAQPAKWEWKTHQTQRMEGYYLPPNYTVARTFALPGCTPPGFTNPPHFHKKAVDPGVQADGCDPSKMSQGYCAAQCTLWFLRKNTSNAYHPVERYEVYAATTEGKFCWCSPMNEAAADPPVPRWSGASAQAVPCTGYPDETCGDERGHSTVVRISCHSSIWFLFVAALPVVWKVIDVAGSILLGKLRASCLPRAPPNRGFTVDLLCGGNNNCWRLAKAANGPKNSVPQTQRRAYLTAAVRLVPLLQPVIFIWQFGHYAAADDMMDFPQKIFGAIVAVREVLFLVLIGMCLHHKPSFLLVDVYATYTSQAESLKSGPLFLCLYLMAPEKFLALVYFQTQPTNRTAPGQGRALTQTLMKLKNTSTAQRGKFAFWGGAMLDLSAVGALISGSISGQVPYSLSFGYFVTFMGFVFYAIGLCREAYYKGCGEARRTAMSLHYGESGGIEDLRRSESNSGIDVEPLMRPIATESAPLFGGSE